MYINGNADNENRNKSANNLPDEYFIIVFNSVFIVDTDIFGIVCVIVSRPRNITTRIVVIISHDINTFDAVRVGRMIRGRIIAS
jgi:hypothetical protein